MSLKLSLERPYKDDQGRSIPAVLDIATDGRHIYEPCVSALSACLRAHIVCHV
jgi:hypothetical protein